MTTPGMSKQSEQSGDLNGQPQQKNLTKIRRKRGINKAFPEDTESGTKSMPNNAIPA